MSEKDEAPALRQVLGPVDATCIVVGAIVGVGIFFTPSTVARIAGSGDIAMLAWAVGGLIALLGALTFAELGGLYPRTGGQYEILRDSYGPMPAFLYVFCNATAIQAGAIAIIAIICARNLGIAAGFENLDNPQVLLIVTLLILSLMASNALGVVWGSMVQNVTVFAKIATLLCITLLALAWSDGPPAAATTKVASADPTPGRLGYLFAALVPTLFSFGGWQHALWIGGEIREPHKNVPRAIVGGVLIVVVVYLLANWAYLDLLGQPAVATSGALAADAVAKAWPEHGRRAIAAAVAFSAYGVLNAQLLSGPRLLYAMAKDGRFFKPFTLVSRKFLTPVAAIGLLGAMALALLFIAGERGVGPLLTGVVLIDSVFMVLTGAALFVLRRKRPDAPRPVRAPGYPIVPLLFVLFETGVLLGSFQVADTRTAAWFGVYWIAAAAICYLVFFRKAQAPSPNG